jgi:hypothetical protein
MDNFDLKKYLVENKLTKQSIQNEGFMDMFSKSKPTDTFQGNSSKEFIKWAKSVFDSRKIPSSKSSYWLNDVADGDWDNSYDGISFIIIFRL